VYPVDISSKRSTVYSQHSSAKASHRLLIFRLPPTSRRFGRRSLRSGTKRTTGTIDNDTIEGDDDGKTKQTQATPRRSDLLQVFASIRNNS
jgi:hypothetical protein